MLEFNASNNVVEYEVLISKLKIANRLGAQTIEVFSDSQLIVKKMSGEFDVRDVEL